MKNSEMTLLAKGTAAVLRPILKSLMTRLDTLEGLAGISPESKNLADSYKGTWQWGKQHQRGTLLTDRSSLWLCTKDTSARPGDDHESWRLVSKHGKAPERSK